MDTHNHLCDDAFSGCVEDVIGRALDAGVSMMLQADTSSRERAASYSLCASHPECLKPMLGLYPGDVGEDWREELDSMLSYKDKGPVAVGEIGLDYHYGLQTKELQKEVFRIQLELASEWDLPVNIHLREATEDFFSIIGDSTHLHLRGNIHAFSGSAETFRRLLKHGDWYVGIGGVVTFRNASIARDLALIPLERILLETDAPYLSPVPHRGERNESSYIPLIAAKIAELKGVTVEEVARITTLNARRLFSI